MVSCFVVIFKVMNLENHNTFSASMNQKVLKQYLTVRDLVSEEPQSIITAHWIQYVTCGANDYLSVIQHCCAVHNRDITCSACNKVNYVISICPNHRPVRIHLLAKRLMIYFWKLIIESCAYKEQPHNIKRSHSSSLWRIVTCKYPLLFRWSITLAHYRSMVRANLNTQVGEDMFEHVSLWVKRRRKQQTL